MVSVKVEYDVVVVNDGAVVVNWHAVNSMNWQEEFALETLEHREMNLT